MAVTATRGSFRTRLTKLTALVGAAVLGTTALVACGTDEEGISKAMTPSEPTVVDNPGDATRAFLNESNLMVVSTAGPENEHRAAAIAIAAGAPMLLLQDPETDAYAQQRIDELSEVDPLESIDQAQAQSDELHYWTNADLGESAAEIRSELDRLSTTHVITVGDVDASELGDRTVVADDGTNDGAARLTGTDFAQAEASVNLARDIAEMDRDEPSAPEIDGQGAGDENVDIPTLSVTGHDDIAVFVSSETSASMIATARAAGQEVMYLATPDPRATSESIAAVREGRSVIALGSAFGDEERLKRHIELAADESIPELDIAGGGQMLFPGRRMVAVYGHPGAPVLGVMGEESPEEAVADATARAEEYSEFVDEPVVPMFEVITSIAHGEPGDDGTYSSVADTQTLEPYIDAITEAGGYVVLDLQPGHSTFLEQAKQIEDLLKRPNVGLALDPEWRMPTGEAPGQTIGHVQADEINEVSEWLAELTRENNLPQKMFLLHQFRIDMIPDRDRVNVDHPELSFVLHADGHGTPSEKLATWNLLVDDLPAEMFPAWKNFIDEDQPMFTPEETADVYPTPWVVTYQ